MNPVRCLIQVIICVFVILTAQTTIAASTKKTSLTIQNECPQYVFCHFKDSVIRITENTPTYRTPAGKVIGRINFTYAQVLSLQVRTITNKKSEIWLNVKTASGRKFWILQTDSASSALSLTEDDIESVQGQNSFFKKMKKITESEMLKKLKSESFELGAQFKVQKLFNDIYPIFKNGVLFFKNPRTDEYDVAFVFDSCPAFTKSLREKLAYETVGIDPFKVRYNNLFIENNNKLLTNYFTESCQQFVDKNTAICPTSGTNYEKLVSKIGSLASIEYGSMMSGGCGGVYTSARFKSIDLKSGKDAKITDFFEEADIIRALKADSFVQSKFKREKTEDIDSLEKFTQHFHIQGFAIYEEKTRDGKLRVRIAVDASQLHWTGYAFIGVDLKPKKEFMSEFKAIDLKKELFLVKSVKDLNVLDPSQAD